MVQPLTAVSKWSNRFVWAAIIQGLAATLITIPIFLPTIHPAVAQVIASGSAGTWFLTGYVMYIVVGVVAVGLTALFYHHFEVVLGKRYRGVIANALAWIHLVLMNVGAAAATWLLMYAGYLGESALMPAAEGGGGLTALQVHEQILVHYVNPIGALLAVTAVGVLAGGLGFLITYFRK
ncbi:MAG: hypothetical protein JRN52_02170 [Nitrososphaerota archaeon]|nr:hypothetical protein [Nitrososphaerota archaeon]